MRISELCAVLDGLRMEYGDLDVRCGTRRIGNLSVVGRAKSKFVAIMPKPIEPLLPPLAPPKQPNA